MHRGEAEGWGGGRNDSQGGGNSRSRKNGDLEDTRLRKQTLGQAWSPSKPGGRTGDSSFVNVYWVSIVSGNVGFSGLNSGLQRGLQSVGEVDI